MTNRNLFDPTDDELEDAAMAALVDYLADDESGDDEDEDDSSLVVEGQVSG